jgi:hypothetical protein
MPNLADYYKDLLAWEGIAPLSLVHAWPTELRDEIERDLEDAVVKAKVKRSNCPITAGSTNQSIGNQVEVFTIAQLQPHTISFSIESCPGSGYPDKKLIQKSSGLALPLEVKATSEWDSNDANRRVLTSSSQKLRTQFNAPIHHLLLTILYTPKSGNPIVCIDAIRLDFIEPTTPVNVRLEASVNHKILSHGKHYSKII